MYFGIHYWNLQVLASEILGGKVIVKKKGEGQVFDARGLRIARAKKNGSNAWNVLPY